MLRHLGSLIPGQGPTELRGQRGDRARNGVTDRLGAMPGERGPILHANAGVMARHARQVEQEREPRGALHQRADGGTTQPQDEIPLPVPRHRPVGYLRRPLADQEFGRDEGLPPPAGARPLMQASI